MRHGDKNERRRIRFIVSMDAVDGDDGIKEINTIFQQLRTLYANRNMTVGGVRETKDRDSSQRMR